MKLLAELRRRNVIRMAGLYLVGAWLVVQVAQTVLPAFEVPGWVLRAIILVLALGFLPALVFSWVFELTPEGLKRDTEVDPARSIAPQTAQRMNRLIVLGLACVIAVVAADRYWPRERPGSEKPGSEYSFAARGEPDQTATEAKLYSDPGFSGSGIPTGNSIAVLPFVNMSSDPEQEFFSDGLSEELLNLLAQLPQLKVIARTSSFSFKGKDVDVATIARQLGVAHVLEGSVRRSGDTIRITAQLILAADSTHLWSKSFDRQMDDIFQLQDEIAGEVVAALKLKLLPEQRLSNTSRTRSSEAYEAVLFATELMRKGGYDELDRATAQLERALELDPAYADAHAARSSLLMASGEIAGDMSLREAMQRQALASAEQAIMLAPELATGYAARSYVRLGVAADWRGAERDLLLALALAPNSADILSNLAWLQRDLGRIDEPLRLGRKAVELDPLAPFSLADYGLSLVRAGRSEEARDYLLRAVTANPRMGWAQFSLGQLALEAGNTDAALAHFRAAGPGLSHAGIAMAEHRRGDTAAAQRALDELVAQNAAGFAYQIAQVHIWRGEPDQALQWLQTAIEQRDLGAPRMRWDPLFVSLHDDQRFQVLLSKLPTSE